MKEVQISSLIQIPDRINPTQAQVEEWISFRLGITKVIDEINPLHQHNLKIDEIFIGDVREKHITPEGKIALFVNRRVSSISDEVSEYEVNELEWRTILEDCYNCKEEAFQEIRNSPTTVRISSNAKLDEIVEEYGVTVEET